LELFGAMDSLNFSICAHDVYNKFQDLVLFCNY
jgi:hypothetical protein